MNDKNYFVGVDIGGTKISIVFFEGKKIVKKIKFKTNPPYGVMIENPEIITNNIIRNIIEFNDNIDALGIAATGIINNGKWSPINKKIIGDFKNFSLVKTIKDQLNKPVFAFGDTEAAALGEFRFGAGKNLSDFFYITVSTGVGGGMILDKKLYSKSPNLAGAFGHMVIIKDGNICGCGRRGCIEAYSSGTAIEAVLRKIDYNLSIKDLFLKYNQEKWANKIITDSAKVIAEGIVNITFLLGIKNFIIGGSIGLSDIFFKQIKICLKMITKEKINIIRAGLRNDAEVYGCLAKSIIGENK